MSYSALIVSEEQLKKYVDEELEEEVYADKDTIPAGTTDPKNVKEGTIPEGYDAVIMGLACNQNENVYAWIKRKGKQVFPDGLNTYALGGITNEETPLMIPLREKDKWALGFTNQGTSDVTVYWRLRIRLIKKK